MTLSVFWAKPKKHKPEIAKNITHLKISFFHSTCHDTNECEEIPNLCGEHGDCLNTPGTFQCRCHEGFELDETGEVMKLANILIS